jgi:G3E family GTPase
MQPDPIALTVVGGYLGAGKTSLINHLLRNADGRRIGVIVNDFGSLAIDADLLEGADRDGEVIGLANGCACCSVGAGLHEALEALTARDARLEHIVIEVSGVADPTAAAAWATVPPFEPAGVIVLADATAVERLAGDRYVGDDVRRQLRGADLLAVTKTDLCSSEQVARAAAWLARIAPDVPRIEVVDGVVAPAVVLGVRSTRPDDPATPDERVPSADRDHERRYDTWSWSSTGAVELGWLSDAMAALPDTVVRAKGVVRLVDGTAVTVHRVGRRVDIRPSARAVGVSKLVAIGVRTDPPTPIPPPFR